jgi:membrane-bound metal-dependent hydrolase YbcI (DUF457 family)
MSSFIGHSLAAFSIYSLNRQSLSNSLRKWWLAWLIIIASTPDIDHIVRSFHLKTTTGYDIRITHSILLSLLIPLVTVILLYFFGYQGRNLISYSRQAIFAGLSHPLLDLLTGVNSPPLLWPFSNEAFKLPFGLLPSAGKIDVFNYFFYRNLLIELGVLIPLFSCLYLIQQGFYRTLSDKLKVGGLLIISILFMCWAFSLNR